MVRTLNEEEKLDRDEAKRDVKMWIANGWDLVEETPEYFLLKRNESTGWGHFWVFLLTFWWTFGIGNLIYYFASNKKKKVIK
jgi:hypothetical protein